VVLCLFAHLSLASNAPHYALTVAIDYAAGSYSGEVHVDYSNTTGAVLDELFFRLYPNATGIYGGASLHVTETRVGDRIIETSTHVEDTVLYVPLPEPLALDGGVGVTIAFEGNADNWIDSAPAARAYGLLTRSERAMTLTAFYPILALHTNEGWALDPVFTFGDALMSEASSYDVRLTAPSGLAPATSGTLLKEQIGVETEGEGTSTYHYSIEGARDFSIVLLDGYEEQAEVIEGVSLRVWFTPARARTAQITLQRAADALALFNAAVGPIRYREVDIVEVPLQVAAGVEFSGLILVSTEYAKRPLETFYDVIVSHEMAHQWFYAGVGNDVSEHPWLDESLATYLSYLFLDVYGGPGVASGTLDQWESAYERARRDAPHVAIDSPIYAFPGSSTYSGFVYSGGAVLLHAIREFLDDAAFFAALASYYTDHVARIAPPNALLDAFEAACNCQLTDLLSAYDLQP